MATTPRLGTADSILANIELGKGSVFHPDNAGRAPYGPEISKPAINGLGMFRADPFIQVTPGGSTVYTFGSNVTAGSTIVVCTGGFAGDAQPSGCTDTLGNTYTKLIGAGGGNGACTIWATFNIASGGANAVTMTGMGGLGPSGCAFEYGLGPNAKLCAGQTSSGNFGTPHHVTNTLVSTGFFGLCVTSGSANIGGGYSRGAQFQHSVNPAGRFYQAGFAGNFMESIGTWTSGAGNANMVGVMLTDNEGAGVLSAAGSATLAGVGLAIFEGGNILLETGDRLLLETGDGALLESTATGGTLQADGAAAVTFVGAAVLSGVLNAAGSSAVDFGSFAATGTGELTFRVPALSGEGYFSNPYSQLDQYAVEDLEYADPVVQASQEAVEDLEMLDPTGPQLDLLSQIAVEDLEYLEPTGPQGVQLSQYCVEILIPFTCDLPPTPVGCPLEPEVPADLGAGCVAPGEDPAAAGAGCRVTL